MKHHPINISYSEQDGGHIADLPDLESCSAFHKTPEEALLQVQFANSACLVPACAEAEPFARELHSPAKRALPVSPCDSAPWSAVA